MMSKIDIKNSLFGDCFIVAPKLRDMDIKEVWASHNLDGLTALKLSYKNSYECKTIFINGMPEVMFGLVRGPIMTGYGLPWLLGSNKIDNYKIKFIRQSKIIINEFLEICPILEGKVLNSHYKSISWLKCCGFALSKPFMVGSNKQYFRKFRLERR